MPWDFTFSISAPADWQPLHHTFCHRQQWRALSAVVDSEIRHQKTRRGGRRRLFPIPVRVFNEDLWSALSQEVPCLYSWWLRWLTWRVNDEPVMADLLLLVAGVLSDKGPWIDDRLPVGHVICIL